MKKLLTNNAGLKIASFVIAFVLWVLVLNIDDPVISRTYTGIPVEITSTEAIAKQGKVYQVLEGSDTISVVVSAKRSVIEKMSKDYIKATADMKDITFMNTVSIDVKSSKYSDRLESITPLTKNLKVQIEDLLRIQFGIDIETEGTPLKGYVLGNVSSNVNVVTVSGPKSVVSKISDAKAIVDVDNFSTNISTNTQIKLYDGNGESLKNDMLAMSIDSVHVDVEVLETKEIPIVASASGTTAEGYLMTGEVLVEPESVIVAGSGNAFNDLTEVRILADDLALNGASSDVTMKFGIKKYLPENVRIVEGSTTSAVVTVKVNALETVQIDIPTANLSLVNVPAGYGGAIVDIGGYKRVSITGFADDLAMVDPMAIMGTIDASNMIPHGEIKVGETYFSGLNDGVIKLTLPDRISMTNTEYMEVSLYVLNDDITLPVTVGDMAIVATGDAE